MYMNRDGVEMVKLYPGIKEALDAWLGRGSPSEYLQIIREFLSAESRPF